MQIGPLTKAFVHDLSAIEGWLYDDNVYVTAAIMDAIGNAGVRGPNFEIGVYCGKYLAAMHHCASLYHETPLTVGLDAYLFHGKSEQDARNTWVRLFGSTDGLHIQRGNSLTTSSSEIIEWCSGARPAFISIDGDHAVQPVLSDHVLCAELLARGGVIASDDFCNWRMIGLMEGIARFFLMNNRHRIVPFAFCMHKLYSCHADFHDRYMNALIAWCDANPDLAPPSDSSNCAKRRASPPPARRFSAGRASSSKYRDRPCR